MQSLADSLSTRLSASFASDSDPELVRDAVPFSLKLIESLMAENPHDDGLLYSATKGFTQYAYAFLQQDADEIEDRDRVQASALRQRAAKLYLRARDYGMQGLEQHHSGFGLALKANPAKAVEKLTLREVPLIYWTGLSWAGALSASRDFTMLPQIPQFEALMDRALELQPSFNDGALHNFFINFEMSSPTRKGDKAGRARRHFEDAVAISHGLLAGPYVNYAESAMVPAKNRAEFESLLKTALKIDVNQKPDDRLQNLIFQRRARWLLDRADRLFR